MISDTASYALDDIEIYEKENPKLYGDTITKMKIARVKKHLRDLLDHLAITSETA